MLAPTTPKTGAREIAIAPGNSFPYFSKWELIRNAPNASVNIKIATSLHRENTGHDNVIQESQNGPISLTWLPDDFESVGLSVQEMAVILDF